MTAETASVLRPMRVVELLDAAFRLYRRNFWTFVGIMALVQIPVSLLSMAPSMLMLQGIDATDMSQLSIEYFLGLGLTFVLALVQFLLISGVATLALTRAIISTYLGEKIGVLESFQKTWPLLGRFLIVLVLIGLITVGLYIWTLVPCIGWLSGPGILLTVAMAITPFAAPIVILENHGATATISRVWDLVRRRFWWLIGLMSILYLFNLALVGPAALFSVFSTSASESIFGFTSMADRTLISTIVQTLVGVLASVLYLPLQFTVIVLAYFDIRARTEGIDLFFNAAQGEGQPLGMAQIAEMPMVSYSTQTVTGTEIGYFIILTLVVILLYALLFGAILLFSAGSLML